MEYTSRKVIAIFLTLTLLNTLAASFIWGINTLFLLNAGLTNTEAFAANAFFTAGEVLFEVPTGIVADTKGRRLSFLLGSITLIIATILYLLMWKINASFWGWAISSILLGLGFTFFSGATQAWIVDALAYTKFEGSLDSVFAKEQIVTGIGMLTGSVAGGVIAQYTNLGFPYIVRSVLLILGFLVALFFMFDKGFKPETSQSFLKEIRHVMSSSITYGLKNPPARWIILSSMFTSGIGIYGFYALQPYLLQLYGDPKAYTIAGLSAAIVAGAQIVGGLLVPYFKILFRYRTSILFLGVIINTGIFFAIGTILNFWIVIVLTAIWSIIFAATFPVRQSYLNGIIPSQQRATILSFDSMVGSGGGVIFQPVLGKFADVWSYAASYIACGVINMFAWPLIWLAKKEKAISDKIK